MVSDSEGISLGFVMDDLHLLQSDHARIDHGAQMGRKDSIFSRASTISTKTGRSPESWSIFAV